MGACAARAGGAGGSGDPSRDEDAGRGSGVGVAGTREMDGWENVYRGERLARGRREGSRFGGVVLGVSQLVMQCTLLASTLADHEPIRAPPHTDGSLIPPVG